MEQETLEVVVTPVDLTTFEAQERAQLDTQIVTAKKYPRNIQRIRQNVIALAAMDEDTAKACCYALPRDGKTIQGASVTLARIIAQQYGNLRVDSKIIDIDRTHVTGQALCIDLENNVGIRVSVKRKITTKNGTRYSDDMITMTGNAACAIALRNAIFNVIPRPIIEAAYKAAQEKMLGDTSSEVKFLEKRKKWLDAFLNEFGVTEQDILRVLSLREITQLDVEAMKKLIGLYTAIKDGDTTVEEAFGFLNTDTSKASAKGEKAAEIVKAMTEAKSGGEKKRATPINPNPEAGTQQGELL